MLNNFLIFIVFFCRQKKMSLSRKVIQINVGSMFDIRKLDHFRILNSLKGYDPRECIFEIRVPKLNQLMKSQKGRGPMTEWEAKLYHNQLEEEGNKKLQQLVGDIVNLYLAISSSGIAKFLQSSIVVINLAIPLLCFQGQKMKFFDLESNFYRTMICSKGISILTAGRQCRLNDEEYGIYPLVKIPISSRSIFPNFADKAIRSELLTLSMSMKMFRRLVPLHYLRNNLMIQNTLHKNLMIQTQFVLCIAQYICRKFIKKQMLKIK